MAIDKNAIMEHIRGILIALGDDPEREGLKETPERVANMYEEIFEGMNYTNREIADMFCKTFELPDSENDDMVIVKDIEVFSHCEHHLALMYDMKVTFLTERFWVFQKSHVLQIWQQSVCSFRKS